MLSGKGDDKVLFHFLPWFVSQKESHVTKKGKLRIKEIAHVVLYT